MTDLRGVRPFSLNMSKVFEQACIELLTPYPSIKLPEWNVFNQITGGLRTREFTILCGSTGSGKTTWLSNLSAQLLKAKTKHFVMSVETGHTDFMKRIMSVLSGRDLNTGDPVSPEILKRVNDNYSRLLLSECIEFSLYDNRVKLGQLVHDLEYMHSIKGCKVAMI